MPNISCDCVHSKTGPGKGFYVIAIIFPCSFFTVLPFSVWLLLICINLHYLLSATSHWKSAYAIQVVDFKETANWIEAHSWNSLSSLPLLTHSLTLPLFPALPWATAAFTQDWRKAAKLWVGWVVERRYPRRTKGPFIKDVRTKGEGGLAQKQT